MSWAKFDERAYPQPEFWRGRPVGEQDDELMAREQYEQREEGADGNDADER